MSESLDGLETEAAPHPASLSVADQRTTQSSGQTTNEPAENPSAAAEQLTVGSEDDDRGQTSMPISRVTSLVSSLFLGSSQVQNQAFFVVSTSADGARILTLKLKLNKAVIFIIVHFLVVFAVSFCGFFLQVWSTFNTTPSVSPDQMQHILQGFTSDGSKDVLDAFERHDGDQNISWNDLIQVLRACLNYSGNKFSNKTCEAALQSFNTNHSSQSETYKKRAELMDTVRDLSLHPASLSSSLRIPQSQSGLIVAIVICLSILLLPWILLMRHRAKSAIFMVFAALRKQTARSDEHDQQEDTAQRDQIEAESNYEKIGGTTTSVSIGNGAHVAGSVQRRNNSKQLRSGDIWTAAAQGALDVVQDLWYSTEVESIDAVHSKYGTILSAASRSGNKRLVNRILQWKPNPAIVGGHFHTALQSAAHSGDIDVVRILLDHHARDNSVGGYYSTALNAAAERGSLEMVQTLIELDPEARRNINVPGGTHGTPLIAAAFRGQLAMVKLLIGNGADINAANDSDTTALHTAAAGNHATVVEELLLQGSDINRVSKVYGTALHTASSNGQEAIALMLVEKEANVALIDQQGRTPLHEAARLGLNHLALALLESNACNVNAIDSDGNTALHHAAIGGHAEISSHLISHGIDVSVCDKFKAQALFRAAGCHHPRVVEILLRDGHADPNARDCFGRAPLHGPSQTNDVEVHELLLEYGAQVNAVGEDKRTALHEACNMGRLNNVKLLLSRADVNVNLVDNNNCTALYYALSSSDGRYEGECLESRIVELLVLRDDIDVNVCHGIAFQEAVRKGMTKVMKTMLEKHHANVHLQGGEYGGIVQAAAVGGHTEILELLLGQWRGNVNAVGGEFGTPLSAAVAYGHLEATRVLLDAGASVDVRGVGRYGCPIQSVGQRIENVGPLEIQRRCGELVELLERYAGKPLSHDVDTPHIEDRWHHTTGGWVFLQKGEM